MTVVETPPRIAKRLSVSIEFARMHQGRHTCVDGKWYNVSCLLSDPDCDHIARSYLKRLKDGRS